MWPFAGSNSCHKKGAASRSLPTGCPTPCDEAIGVTLPSLIALQRQAGLLNLQQTRIGASQSGGFLSRFKGRGMEFDEVRTYTPGDDVRAMDWRVTARTGKPHTKLYREERERPIFLSVDYRPTMFFATRNLFKSVLAARLAALLAWSGHQHGDRVGGQVFNRFGQTEIKPRHSKGTVLHLLETLAELSLHGNPDHLSASPAPATMGHAKPAATSLNHAMGRLHPHARPGSMVFLISDFRGWNREAELELVRLSRHCEVALLFVYDPLEAELPPGGRFRFSDGTRELEIDTTSRSLRKAYQERFQGHLEHLKSAAKRLRLRFIPCATTEEPLQILTAKKAPRGP